MLLLQPFSSIRFGDFWTGKNWGRVLSWVSCSTWDMSTLGSFEVSSSRRVCGFKAGQSLLCTVGLSRQRSSMWHFFSLSRIPKGDFLNLDLACPSWLWYCLYIMIIWSVPSFDVILHAPFHVDERPCPFYTFAGIDGSTVYKFCHHDLISFKMCLHVFSLFLGVVYFPLILQCSFCHLCVW